MSAFVALIGLRRYLRDHPNTPVDEAANSLQRSDADLAAADFQGALRLHSQFSVEIDFSDPVKGLRAGLGVLIDAHRPWWCRFFPYGRQRLATSLTQDELQTFRSAGLYEDFPQADVVAWWDAFASLMRSAEDERLNTQGRHAERLSLEYERERLNKLGISEEPRWIALDDNSAGYDLQSYERTEYGLKNLLIEVKSSQRHPPRMILTRGEWKAAAQYGDAYIFHLWQLPAEELTVLTVADIAQHVPQDQGKGSWTELEISF
ncbi:hypothetical protein HNQ96_004966 [Aminobacter lissarensis]|uniref:Protein NO VEIN C-terminal domain-containing protein n=1 Tax=Aminobacter carboxidus TaxID=376165 RepID=A0A8E1WL33_9HYPH|nr:DUF3883 domain-containing protein [Aminobacter lissarensis]MBB6469077.1 hypothetical protein [Aminobacter lissarensis]